MSEDYPHEYGIRMPDWVLGVNGRTKTWLVRDENGETKWTPLPIAWPDEWVVKYT